MSFITVSYLAIRLIIVDKAEDSATSVELFRTSHDIISLLVCYDIQKADYFFHKDQRLVTFLSLVLHRVIIFSMIGLNF